MFSQALVRLLAQHSIKFKALFMKLTRSKVAALCYENIVSDNVPT